MNAPTTQPAAAATPAMLSAAPATAATLMTGADYRDSLRRYRPVVYVDGQLIGSVADAPQLQPGINALAVSYDFEIGRAHV